jgi:dTDP-4-dehydrorhamnose 3,5-epimerase
MIFHPAPLKDAYTIAGESRYDDRGLFARAFCADEFRREGLVHSFAQVNLSDNHRAGTIRGMHFQKAPHAEVKLVRCVKGAIYDVIVDIRPDSPTYLQWFGATLSAENGLMMYVPEGFAHGYQSLEDHATAFYLVSTPYAPGAEGGLRHDDPQLAIRWPISVTSVSPKDVAWPLLPERSSVEANSSPPIHHS